MGGFLTSTTVPTVMVRDGFTALPPMLMRPFLQASAAMLRVLKRRIAQSHLSILTSDAATLLIIKLVHGNVNASQTETFNDINGNVNAGRQGGLLFGSKFAQNKVNLSAAGIVVAQSKA